MQVEIIHEGRYRIAMTPEEERGLMVIVSQTKSTEICTVSDLIKFHLEFLSKSYFSTVKEPEPDGN